MNYLYYLKALNTAWFAKFVKLKNRLQLFILPT